MNIVLAGNPNAGKTTLFNALTHSNLKTGNWHGVTTAPAQKTVNGNTYTDVPGMYSFDAYSMEEASAAESVKNADVIVNVVDCLTLENSLRLTEKLIAINKKVVVYLTKSRQLKARGGRVDREKLQTILGVPVLQCTPNQLKNYFGGRQICSLNFEIVKQKIPFNEAYYGGNYKLKATEKPFYNKYFAIAFFMFAMVFTFFITFHPAMIGTALKEATENLICEKLSGVLGAAITNDILRSFVCEGILGGAGGVLSFIPQITILYLLLILLDESGIMSALCFVTDGLFEKVNLSGRAAFSLISGFGCTAAAIATTRGYSDASAQRRTVAVLLIYRAGQNFPFFLHFYRPSFKILSPPSAFFILRASLFRCCFPR